MNKFAKKMGVAIGACLMFATMVSAQKSVPVTLLLKDSFGKRPELTAIVRVDHGKFAKPVIAMKKSAMSPELLLTAISTLAGMREKFGESPTGMTTVEITERSRMVAARDAAQSKWAINVVASLEKATERNVAIVGKARELTVAIPFDK